MSKKIDVSAFLPKISKPSKIGSNLSTVSTSSKLSLRRLNPPRQKDKFLATLSLVHRPVSEVPHAEDSSTVTDTAAASPASKTKPSSSKPSSPKPGPSCVPAKSPRKRVSPKPAQNHVKSGRISKGKQTHRLSYPIHTLLDDDVEVVDDPAPLPVDQKTPSKSPRKRPASATPSKSKTGPSPAKSSRKSPRKPLDALGFCKICQLPLVCIKIPEIQHTRECEVPSDSPECPDGVTCKSSDRMHYTSYNHSELARLRANDSDIKVLDNSEPSEQVTVEPDLPIGNKSGSKKVHDNPFLCESSDDDISADYNSERNGQPDEEEFEAEVVPDNQEAQEDEIVHPCIGGICDENKLSVSITSNGETVTFCVNEENNRWDNGGCKDCSGIVSSSCICGKNLALEMLSKEVFFKKQMEAKEKWACNPIMNRQRSKDSSAASLSSVASSTENKSRACPSYKLIGDTSFAVDAFNHGKIPSVKFHFLSHFHYDHYIGLNKHFTGIIYCSQITANLVKHHFKLADKQLRVLPLDETIVVDGVKVTALDANHCPGAVMLLFQLLDGTNVVHTGDFRFSPAMESYSAFWNIHIDILHLDTTYCNEKYDFEPQEEILQLVGNLAEEKYQLSNKKCLFVCGSYTIGKEKVFVEIARKLNCKVYAAEPGKKKILKLLNDPSISEYMVEKAEEANIHVLPNGKLYFSHLSNYLNTVNKKGRRFTSVVAFNPTGWQHSSKRIELYRELNSGNVTIIGVPYSEHSSFSELKRFVKFLKPRKIVPTVRSKGCGWQDISMKCNNWIS